jgi:hypothetical protein
MQKHGGVSIIELIQLTIISTMIVPVCFAYKYARDYLVGSGDYQFPYWFLMVQLGLAAIVMLLLAVIKWIRCRKKPQLTGKGGSRRQAIYLGVTAIYLLAAWIAPAIMVNLGDKTGALTRAQWRYYQGKWADAVAIYRCIPCSDENEAVRSMQALLKDAGYYKAPVDGKSLRHILPSLRRLQRDYGLAPDGILGPKTRTIIFGRVYREVLGLSEADLLDFTKIREAVIKFQRKSSLPPDGDVGWLTATTLGEAAKACKTSGED